MDRIVYVPLPDEQTRAEIFKIQFRKMPIAEDVCMEELIASTHRYSGAEVSFSSSKKKKKTTTTNLVANTNEGELKNAT